LKTAKQLSSQESQTELDKKKKPGKPKTYKLLMQIECIQDGEVSN
jgi:hypothetical protein